VDRHDWDARYAGQELVWSLGPNQFLEAEAAGMGPGRALDLACGEGRNALWLASLGWTATGVDFSERALDKARRLAADRQLTVEWIAGDLLDFVPPERSYDLVIVFYLQLPADQRNLVFQRAAAAVEPGGTLLVVAHDSRNLAEGYGGPRDPGVLYGPQDVVDAVRDSGLDVVKAERVHRDVETDEGPRVAIDCLVRLARPS
jgi:SAM-dependent methyltransferase